LRRQALLIKFQPRDFSIRAAGLLLGAFAFCASLLPNASAGAGPDPYFGVKHFAEHAPP
jgi:hypothetical protein